MHLRVETRAGGPTLRWARRSRAGWRWTDGADAPLIEEREAYRIDGAAGGRESALPELALDPGETGPFNVRQLGTHGASPLAAKD